jgi:hypothetical protein
MGRKKKQENAKHTDCGMDEDEILVSRAGTKKEKTCQR